MGGAKVSEGLVYMVAEFGSLRKLKMFVGICRVLQCYGQCGRSEMNSYFKVLFQGGWIWEISSNTGLLVGFNLIMDQRGFVLETLCSDFLP